MRHLIIAVIVALVFSPAMALGGTKHVLDDHETRISDLETNEAAHDAELADHENRIGDLETNDATQDSMLGDHETRIGDLEQQTSVGGIKVYDVNEIFLGVVCRYAAYQALDIFIPEISAFATVEDIDRPETSVHMCQTWLVYETADCSGQAYGDFVCNYKSLQVTGQGENTFYSARGALSDHAINYSSCRDETTGICSPCTPSGPADVFQRPEALMIDKLDMPFDPDLIVGPLQFK